MWLITYQTMKPGSEKREGNSTFGFTVTWDDLVNSEIITVHPLIYVKKNPYPKKTILSWQKFTEDDEAAYQELKIQEAIEASNR